MFYPSMPVLIWPTKRWKVWVDIVSVCVERRRFEPTIIRMWSVYNGYNSLSKQQTLYLILLKKYVFHFSLSVNSWTVNHRYDDFIFHFHYDYLLVAEYPHNVWTEWPTDPPSLRPPSSPFSFSNPHPSPSPSSFITQYLQLSQFC